MKVPLPGDRVEFAYRVGSYYADVLTPAERWLLGWVCLRTGQKRKGGPGGLYFAKHEIAAQETGLSEKTVGLGIDRFERLGIMSRLGHRVGRIKEYRVNYDHQPSRDTAGYLGLVHARKQAARELKEERERKQEGPETVDTSVSTEPIEPVDTSVSADNRNGSMRRTKRKNEAPLLRGKGLNPEGNGAGGEEKRNGSREFSDGPRSPGERLQEHYGYGEGGGPLPAGDGEQGSLW